jgi:hypothetical protein
MTDLLANIDLAPDAAMHRHMLPLDLPFATVIVLTIAAVAIWLLVHFVASLVRSQLLPSLALFFVRCLIASVSLWMIANTLARLIVLSSSWSIPGICIFIAIAIELVFSFYQFERRSVSPGLGRALCGLRIALLLTLGLMLLQPIFAWTFEQTHERFIAVLVDDSQSMQIIDKRLTPAEKLRVVRLFNADAIPREYDLSNATPQLMPLIEELTRALESLEQSSGTAQKNDAKTGVTQPDTANAGNSFALRNSLKGTAAQAKQHAINVSQQIKRMLETHPQLTESKKQQANQQIQRLDQEIVARLVTVELELQKDDRQSGTQSLENHFRAVLASLRQVILDLPAVIESADEQLYASLDDQVKRDAEKLVTQTRLQIARNLLGGEDQPASGLVEKIKSKYSVRLYRFSADCEELDADRIETLTDDQLPDVNQASDKKEASDKKASDGKSDERAQRSGVQLNRVAYLQTDKTDPTAETEESASPAQIEAEQPAPEKLKAAAAVTDFSRAIERVKKDIPLENLAGILLVTDGRNNAEAPDALITQLARLNVPLSAIVVGSSQPPMDAAIMKIDAPATVFVEDQLVVSTRVQLTGLKDRQVKVKLMDGEELLSNTTVTATSDLFTTDVELSHVPDKGGLVDYHVELEAIDTPESEQSMFAQNNRRNFTVAISDNRTEVLLIEGRPRWEFNYLYSLFANRDKTVQLQSVLLEPDKLSASSKRPDVHASASRDSSQTEATLLPASEEEWFKFDLIILGDVPPAALSGEDINILHRFVNKRGGTLIVIAGSRYMPHRYVDTALAELLPAQYESSGEVLFASPEPEFRFQLTQIGQRHAITRLAETEEDSNAIWQEVPEFYWRHPLKSVKPGATVLAYAAVAAKEQELQNQEKSNMPLEARNLARKEYESANALMLMQNFGAGRVLMMNTDRTWRLRYRVGDVNHHRFWGQALRWAAAKRLPGGTNYVQVGTPRSSYRLDEPIIVSAKLTDESFASLDDPAAAVKIFHGGELVVSKKLEPVADYPGMFQVDLGKMPSGGTYRIELDSPVAKQVFAGKLNAPITAEFNVRSPEQISIELQEPAADRRELTRLAGLGNGAMLEIDANDKVIDYFAAGTERYIEPHSVRLWDTWPLLLLMVALVTAEWIVRKKGGLV